MWVTAATLLMALMAAWLQQPMYPHRPLMILIYVVGFGVFAWKTANLYGDLGRTIWRTVHSKAVFAPILAMLSLAGLSSLVAAEYSGSPFVSPGSIFLVIVAILTTLSTIVALSRIGDIHGRILDFSHLLQRMQFLLEEERARLDADLQAPGRLVFVANFPAFGSVSGGNAYAAYDTVLRQMLDRPQVVGTYAFLDWKRRGGTSAMETFINRFPLDDNQKKQKCDTSLALLRKMKAAVVDRHGQPKELFAFSAEVDEVPFHLMMTEARAIVAIALNYPVVGHGNSRSEVPTVHVIGFETTDPAIISELQKGVKARLAAQYQWQPEDDSFPHD